MSSASVQNYPHSVFSYKEGTMLATDTETGTIIIGVGLARDDSH
jgi:hypothetical protein